MEWKDLAEKLSYDYITESLDIDDYYPDFSIWNWGTGRSKKILGGVKKSFPGGHISILDYEYEHSRNMQVPATSGMIRGLSLCFLKFKGLDLPEIYQRNEAPIQKMFKRAVGKHDISFKEDNEFSERFEIQGPELGVKHLYRPEVRSYFLRHFEYAPLRLELRGDTILLHFGMMLEPASSRILLYRMMEIANFWAKSKIDLEIQPDYFFKEQ